MEDDPTDKSEARSKTRMSGLVNECGSSIGGVIGRRASFSGIGGWGRNSVRASRSCWIRQRDQRPGWACMVFWQGHMGKENHACRPIACWMDGRICTAIGL